MPQQSGLVPPGVIDAAAGGSHDWAFPRSDRGQPEAV